MKCRVYWLLAGCDVFQCLVRKWEKYAGERSKAGEDRITVPAVEKVLLSTELVLDQSGKLREANRVAGENEVKQYNFICLQFDLVLSILSFIFSQ